jgi:exportin-7
MCNWTGYRDLRGLAFAFNTKQSYMILFDWLYPDYAAVYLRALQLWYHQPQVDSYYNVII